MTSGRPSSLGIGASSSSAINVSNAPSASPPLWNAHSGSALHSARKVVSVPSNPATCCSPPSTASAFGSDAPSSTAARTVSGNSVAHVAPSSLP